MTSGAQADNDDASDAPQARPSLVARIRSAVGLSAGVGSPVDDPNATSFDHRFHVIPAAVRTHMGLAMLFSGAINVLYLAPSLYMMQVYDRVLNSGGLTTLLFLSLVVVAATATLAAIDAVRGRLMGRLSLRFERLLAEPLLTASLRFAGRQSSDRPSANVRDLDTFRNGVAGPAVAALMDLPWTPLYIFICFMLHPWIGFLAVGGSILIFLVAYANERAARASIETASTKAPQFYGAFEADLRAAESARALGLESAIVTRRLKDRVDLVDAQTDGVMKSAGYSSITKFLRLALQSAALGLGAYLAVHQQISPGSIIAATILTTRAFTPVQSVVGGWRQIVQTFTAYRSLATLLDTAPSETARTTLPDPRGAIQLIGVAASPLGVQRPTIVNVTFAAAPGEIIGIVGPSGAGKSTLARVLANASAPLAGVIRIDGASYADWSPQALARHIGYLPQSVDLFAGSIAENISGFALDNGADSELTAQQVVEAAKAAGSHDMILSLPQGYDTVLGLGGRGLSLGQSQRVALARALFGKPVLLVFDEPNAHLDADGEAALVAALKAAKARGAVAFVVAHRAGIMSVADKLMVLRNGQLVEHGARDEVTAKLAVAAGASPMAAPHSGQGRKAP